MAVISPNLNIFHVFFNATENNKVSMSLDGPWSTSENDLLIIFQFNRFMHSHPMACSPWSVVNVFDLILFFSFINVVANGRLRSFFTFY